MRSNFPVTDVETLLPEGEFIYSRTDLRGNIIEANDAFARISGYSREEMLGQPHNIVRHPDVPPEAFADLWRDLKAGLPWRGLVKNRRKDGGYYWVIANASPVREGGQIVGFQSVRARPSREDVAAAEEAYRRIRSGDKSIRIEHGRVVPQRTSTCLNNLGCQTGVASGAMLSMGAALVVSAIAPGLIPESVSQGLGAVGLLAGVYFMAIFRPKLRRDLAATSNYLDGLLSSGDLRCRLSIERPDMVGGIAHRLDRLTAWIQSTLQGMGEASSAVRLSAQEVAHGVVVLNESTRVQCDATSSAAAGIEEITVSIGEVAAHAGSTHTSAESAAQVSAKGVALANHACSSILSLAETVKASAAQVERLGVQSEEISRITGVIREIAEQTNLLALNAAIEAARAGEQGRGFAVVADEVRKLAERTSKATQEISKMIAAVQDETSKAVAGMRSGAEQVEEGVQFVQDAENSLREINERMTQTLTMIGEISHSSDEQQVAMTLMAQSVEKVAAMTDQNVSLAGETARTSDNLRVVTERMLKAVEQFAV